MCLRLVSPIKTFKFATFGCSHALLPWKLYRYSCRVLFGINCIALDQSELSKFVECTIKYKKIYLIRHFHENKIKYAVVNLFNFSDQGTFYLRFTHTFLSKSSYFFNHRSFHLVLVTFRRNLSSLSNEHPIFY